MVPNADEDEEKLCLAYIADGMYKESLLWIVGLFLKKLDKSLSNDLAVAALGHLFQRNTNLCSFKNYTGFFIGALL